VNFDSNFIQNLSVSHVKRGTRIDIGKYLIFVKNRKIFVDQLNLIIPYFCRDPYRILEEIRELQEESLSSIVKNLEELTQGNTRVWHGTIGEAIATSFILSYTSYHIPVFKLRFAANRKQAMHGDDILGFKFDENGFPKSLLVVEVKNYSSNPNQAVKDAVKGLIKSSKQTPTLFDFLINILNAKGKYDESKKIKRFLDPYEFPYETDFEAFIITDKKKWKPQHVNQISDNNPSPLTITSFLIPDWLEAENGLKLSRNKEPQKLNLPSIEVSEVEEVRALLNNSRFQRDHNLLAVDALYADLKIPERIKGEYSQDKLDKVASYLSLSGLNLQSEDPELANRALRESAEIRERLAIVMIERKKYSEAYRNVVQSALTYCLIGYSANAKVLFEKLLSNSDITSRIESDHKQTLLSLLFNGDVSGIQAQLGGFFDRFEKVILDENLSNLDEEDWLSLITGKIEQIGDWLFSKAFAHYIQFLKTGKFEHNNSVDKYLDSAANQFCILGDYNSYLLVNHLKKHFNNLFENSPHALIKQYAKDFAENSENWKSYLRLLSTLGKYPMFSLWKSQKIALSNGLLDNAPLLITMPTSAGKTKTVEFAIFQNLIKDNDKICAYVVPTKALASEIEESLSKSLGKLGLGVSVLYGGYNFSYLENDLLGENRIFVLTPEKLDLLLRSNDTFKRSLSLIIIDEVHDMTSDSIRGLKQELIFSRTLYIAEKFDIRVICISAVLNNPLDFAVWMSGENKNLVQTDWRPTRQRIGFLSWPHNVARAQVQYLPSDDNYPNGSFFIPLPFIRSQIKVKDIKNKNKYFSKDVVTAARLSLYYVETGATLVFTTTRALVEKITHALIQLKSQEPSNNINSQSLVIASEAAKILGDQHLIVSALRHGICYHHAELPSKIRKLVEKAVRSGSINLIVSTTTLSQGINLPIKNVIVHTLTTYMNISMSQYSNAVGRAGRAGRETEGHIIFCSLIDLQLVLSKGKTEISESFISRGLRCLMESRLPSLDFTETFLEKWALVTTSQFKEFQRSAQTFEEWSSPRKVSNIKEKISKILLTLDSHLLAWILEAEMWEPNSEIEEVLEKLFCNIFELEIDSYIREFRDSLKNRAVYVKARLQDNNLRKLFNLTGLSIQGNQIINEYAFKIFNEIDQYYEYTVFPDSFWEECYQVLRGVPDIGDKLKEKNRPALLDWVRGKSYKEIADSHFEGKIESVVREVESITFALSWGLNSLARHLSFFTNNKLPSIFQNICAFVTHGVPDVISVFAISFGIYDREPAMLVSCIYWENGGLLDYSTFKDWIFGLTLEDWNSLVSRRVKNPKDFETYYWNIQRKRIANDPSLQSILCDVSGDLEALSAYTADELQVIHLNHELLLASFDYSQTWKLENENLSYMLKLNRFEYDFVVDSVNFEDRKIQVRVL
jgi:replicative superfamily II helicase